MKIAHYFDTRIRAKNHYNFHENLLYIIWTQNYVIDFLAYTNYIQMLLFCIKCFQGRILKSTSGQQLDYRVYITDKYIFMDMVKR